MCKSVEPSLVNQDTEQNTEERISWSLPASLNSTSYSHKQLKSILYFLSETFQKLFHK